MAIYGLKPVCEIQFSGFAFQCFHPDREPHGALSPAHARALSLPDGHAHALWRRRPRARAPLGERGAVLRAYPRAQDGHSLRAAHGPRAPRRRHPRSRSRRVLRGQGPLPRGEGGGPGRAGALGHRARPRGPRRTGSHPRRLRRDAPRLREAAESCTTRTAGDRGHRPPHISPSIGHPDRLRARRAARSSCTRRPGASVRREIAASIMEGAFLSLEHPSGRTAYDVPFPVSAGRIIGARVAARRSPRPARPSRSSPCRFLAMARQFVLPDLGEGLTEAEIVAVLAAKATCPGRRAPVGGGEGQARSRSPPRWAVRSTDPRRARADGSRGGARDLGMRERG